MLDFTSCLLTWHLTACYFAQAISSPEVFHSTLKRVHDCLRISEKVPRVGGRELDLFTLYKNVTALGGCERVISRKQWRVLLLPFLPYLPNLPLRMLSNFRKQLRVRLNVANLAVFCQYSDPLNNSMALGGCERVIPSKQWWAYLHFDTFLLVEHATCTVSACQSNNARL